MTAIMSTLAGAVVGAMLASVGMVFVVTSVTAADSDLTVPVYGAASYGDD